MSSHRTYEIVRNLDELMTFIRFLPNLKENEMYYVSLFSRKKYGGHAGDKCQLKRFTATKDRLIHKLQQLELPLGRYKDNEFYDTENDSLVVYITPNPRNLRKSALRFSAETMKKVAEDKVLGNPRSDIMNTIQVTSSNRLYFDVDIDFKPDKIQGLLTLLENFKHGINQDALNVIHTRGGYHILVNLKKIEPRYKSTWYKTFSECKSEVFEVTMNGDNMVPVPGCTQGGYSPKLLMVDGIFLNNK